MITSDFLKNILSEDMNYEEFVSKIVHNILKVTKNYKITNLRSKHALTYENGEFVSVLKEPTTDFFIEKICEKLQESIEQPFKTSTKQICNVKALINNEDTQKNHISTFLNMRMNKNRI
jgi:hypothetical protein